MVCWIVCFKVCCCCWCYCLFLLIFLFCGFCMKLYWRSIWSCVVFKYVLLKLMFSIVWLRKSIFWILSCWLVIMCCGIFLISVGWLVLVLICWLIFLVSVVFFVMLLKLMLCGISGNWVIGKCNCLCNWNKGVFEYKKGRRLLLFINKSWCCWLRRVLMLLLLIIGWVKVVF